MEPRRACLACLDRPVPALLEAGLWVAAEHSPQIEPLRLLRTLDDLARHLASRPTDGYSPAERAQQMLRDLHEVGFRAADWPLRPAAALLDQVLANRRGQPLSIALVALELAQRLDIRLQGVSFPGHFLLRVPDADHLLHPFGGRRLYPADCRQLLCEQFGPQARLQASHLAPCPPHAMLQRLSRNLRELHQQDGQPLAALKDAQRVLELGPPSAADHLARAALYQLLECPQAERFDLERALLLSEDATEQAEIHQRLRQHRQPASSLH